MKAFLIFIAAISIAVLGSSCLSGGHTGDGVRYKSPVNKGVYSR